jgi:hypothetical protein
VTRPSSVAATIAALCIWLGVPGCVTAQRSERSNYDGHWWQSVSPHERAGFVTGYMDCYSHERGARFTTHSREAYRDLVSKFYEAASNRDEPVASTLIGLQDPRSESEGDSLTDRPGADHGYYDGLYWMQMSVDGPEEQLGFVEGYLRCYSEFARNSLGIFSKSPAEYRSLITQWYRFDEATGDVDAERQPEKIANVLIKLRDAVQEPDTQDGRARR